MRKWNHESCVGAPAGRAAISRRWKTRGALLAVAGGISLGVFVEARSAFLQSMLYSWQAGQLSYSVVAGPTPQILSPHSGPHDERLGYKQLPHYVDALAERGWEIRRHAEPSP